MTSALELVLHHQYATGDCLDRSGHGNHGYTSMDVTAGRGADFDGRTTRVVVFPSRSLADLSGIRARARVWVREWDDRRTIMEGYLAFSFSVEYDGSLAGSVYSGLEWHGLQTPPGTVPRGTWVDVGFVYDGRDAMSLTVDGRILAARYANLGRMGGIEWPYGLNIGAWPDEAARVFSGHMSDVWLWRPRR